MGRLFYVFGDAGIVDKAVREKKRECFDTSKCHYARYWYPYVQDVFYVVNESKILNLSESVRVAGQTECYADNVI